MNNYYSANREFCLNQIDLEEIVSDLENDFQNQGPTALHSYTQAAQWYAMILSNAGEVRFAIDSDDPEDDIVNDIGGNNVGC